MYTQCPHCQTCFRIAEAHLKIANGRVRCGSCQEVFDATRHLFKNLTDREPINYVLPTTPAPAKQTPPPAPREHKQVSPPAGKTDQIDLSRATTPSPKAVEKILSERQKAPDQAKFMESVVGNDRYNNLDKMDAIDIPGDIDFGDSIIKFAEDRVEAEAVKPAAESPPVQTARTTYEDIESKEAPPTQAEQETLENFFAEVDAQLHDDEAKSQLDKDIDELLAFAKGLDQENEAGTTKPTGSAAQGMFTADTHGIEVSEEFDLQAIAEFEKELDATSIGAFSVEQTAQQEQINETPEPETVESAGKAERPAEHRAAAAPKITPAESEAPIIAENEPAADIEIAESLPSHEEEIPRALRHSLEMLDQKPRRPLVQTLLMTLLILILIGGLGFQIVLFRNVELAHQFPNLIPQLTEICARIPCRYSGKVDVSQIKLINRDVRSDPKQPNALLISATFVDQAPFDQPYPVIQITLYDLGGNVVASRRFTPKEYLQKMYNRFLLMESGTPVHITLAVLDPGKDAINFEFSFL